MYQFIHCKRKNGRTAVIPNKLKIRRLSSELIFSIVIKMTFKALCRFRRTTKEMDAFLEYNRWPIANRRAPIQWELSILLGRKQFNRNITLGRSKLEFEVAPIVVNDRLGVSYKYIITPVKNSSMLRDPFAQLSACRPYSISLKIDWWTDEGFLTLGPTIRRKLVPAFQRLQLSCTTFRFERHGRVLLEDKFLISLFNCVRFTKFMTATNVAMENLLSWPIHHCSELHATKIVDAPGKLSPFIRQFEVATLEFKNSENGQLFLDFLMNCRDDREARGVLKYLHISLKQHFNSHIPGGLDFALGLQPIWSGIIDKFGTAWKMPQYMTFLKLEIDGGVALIFYICGISRYEVFFESNGSREKLLEVFGRRLFRYAPYDYSVYFNDFMSADTDRIAFDLIYDNYYM